MKAQFRWMSCVFFVLLVLATALTTAYALPVAVAHGLTVERFVLCSGIQDREPVDEITTFSPEQTKAFAFIELGQVEFNTTVTVVWSYNGEEVALVPLMIGAGSRWRTYSSKNIAGLPGPWKVELISEASEILTAIEFTVN